MRDRFVMAGAGRAPGLGRARSRAARRWRGVAAAAGSRGAQLPNALSLNNDTTERARQRRGNARGRGRGRAAREGRRGGGLRVGHDYIVYTYTILMLNIMRKQQCGSALCRLGSGRVGSGVIAGSSRTADKRIQCIMLLTVQATGVGMREAGARVAAGLATCRDAWEVADRPLSFSLSVS